jgi:Ala-tRNA(Pro) deacylase
MEIPKQLIECLDENKVTYEVLRHPEAVTAQRIAQAEHVKGRHHAKVVMVKSGKLLFPDCAIGGMPPFGNLYGLPTYVHQSLAEQDYIVFEAGTHTEAIKMSYGDYEKIVKPKVNDLAIKLQPMKGA